MERKALENLAAAQQLMAGDDPSPNAAVSRAYYAAYQACWVRMVEQGDAVPESRPGVRYFVHDGFGDLAQDAGLLTEEQAMDFNILLSARITADYREDDVSFAYANACVGTAQRLVEALLEDAP